MRFGRQGKLSPRYIGLFTVLRWVSEVAYELALPSSLSIMHSLFHVSMMKYTSDGSHKLRHDVLNVNPMYHTSRRLCRFLTNLWRHFIGRTYLLWWSLIMTESWGGHVGAWGRDAAVIPETLVCGGWWYEALVHHRLLFWLCMLLYGCVFIVASC